MRTRIPEFGDGRALAHRLSERVRIESNTLTADAQGGYTQSWVQVAEVWAEVLPIASSAAEREEASRPDMRIRYRVVVRVREDIAPDMRIVWNGRYLNIRAVVPGKAHLEIIAEEGVAL